MHAPSSPARVSWLFSYNTNGLSLHLKNADISKSIFFFFFFFFAAAAAAAAADGGVVVVAAGSKVGMELTMALAFTATAEGDGAESATGVVNIVEMTETDVTDFDIEVSGVKGALDAKKAKGGAQSLRAPLTAAIRAMMAEALVKAA